MEGTFYIPVNTEYMWDGSHSSHGSIGVGTFPKRFPAQSLEGTFSREL